MGGNSESVAGIVERHFNTLFADRRAKGAELFACALEALRDICLELPDLHLNAEGQLAERVLAAANQMILGLLYHVAETGVAGPGLNELQQRIESRLQELYAAQEKAAALKHRLAIMDADLNTLREECRLLDQLAGYEKARQQFQGRQPDQDAYYRLLASSVQRAGRQRAAFDELSRQIENLLTQQRQLLQEELQSGETAWQTVEREVFRT